MSNSVSSQDQLNEGNRRINDFEQELLKQGFREISHSESGSIDKTILKGDYGKLKGLEVTLWTGKRLDVKDPQMGGGIQAYITSDEAEREFDELYKKVAAIVSGYSQQIGL